MKTFEKPLTAREERECLQRLKEGDPEARRLLIEHNMRLVAHVVKKYGMQEREAEDLISVGTIGLIKAVNTYDMDKGSRLATYAAKCIDNEILMMFRSEKKHLKVGSLFEPIGTDKEGNEIRLVDIIENDGREIADVVALGQEIRRLYQVFDTALKEKEKFVLKMRYGLFGCREHTQREIAAQMGISRSYVSRIEKAALEKLCAVMESPA